MGSLNLRKQARLKRKKRIRKKVFGSQEKPRLCVFRSTRHIYAQVIDDTAGNTLASASSMEKGAKEHLEKGNKAAIAKYIGKIVAERSMEKGIKKVVFDRSGFLYHGRVKAVSVGAREAGLKF